MWNLSNSQFYMIKASVIIQWKLLEIGQFLSEQRAFEKKQLFLGHSVYILRDSYDFKLNEATKFKYYRVRHQLVSVISASPTLFKSILAQSHIFRQLFFLRTCEKSLRWNFENKSISLEKSLFFCYLCYTYLEVADFTLKIQQFSLVKDKVLKLG